VLPFLHWFNTNKKIMYVLEVLLTGRCQEAHARRIRFFRNSDFEVIRTVLDHLSCQAGELDTIEMVIGIHEWRGSVEVKAHWRRHEPGRTRGKEPKKWYKFPYCSSPISR
jgi:hypothetical protein